MAKMMKRFVASAIVLSMFLGVIAMPTSAEENLDPAAESGESITVTVEIRNENGEVIGERTTVTNVDTNDNDTSFTQQTDVNSSWVSQDTQTTEVGTVTEGSTTTQTTGQVVTEVEGSETATDYVHTDKTTHIETHSGADVGREDTTITDTTTTVTTTQGVVISDETAPTETVLKDDVQQGDWSDLTLTKEGDWVAGELDDQDYVPDAAPEAKVESTAAVDVDADPLATGNAELTMTRENPEDSDTLYISIEDALANDISYTDGQVLENGAVVKFEYKSDGKGGKYLAGYTITKYTPTGSHTGEIQAGTPGEAVPDGGEVATYIQPQDYEVCTDAPVFDDDGNQIGTKTIVEETDKEGNVIGYTITETILRPASELPDNTNISLDVPQSFRTLPQRPEAPEPVTQGGMTTTVTVEDILENNEVIGYKTTTTVTDEDGNVMSTESESIYGTVTSYTSSLETTPTSSQISTTTTTTVYGVQTTQNYTRTTPGTQTTTNTRDVSQEIYELVNTEDGLFFLFEGKMYAVQAITGTGPDVPSQGKVTLSSLTPNLSLTPNNGDGSVNESTDLRNPHYNNYVDVDYGKDYSVDVADGYDYKYIGYGLESAITAKTTNSNGTLVHQFKLQDENGNFHYVLCADFNTTAYRDTDYRMENVEDADYYNDAAAQKIQAVVTRGYWGTTSGVGSLEQVKAFLKEKSDVSDSILNGLTHGEALTATQAAIWYYGHSSDSFSMSNTEAAAKEYSGTHYWYDGKRYWNYESLSNNEKTRVNELYKALIGLTAQDAPNNSTELLDTDNFATQTQLVIKEKATDENGNVKIHEDSKTETYVADLTFTMAVSQSDLTGNLVITITDQYDNVIRTEQLSTNSSNLVGRILADGSAGTDYTIQNLELAEGVTFNLNLSGTQNLQQGAYLYSAEVYSTSQTFIGVASGNQQVNLSVQMEFSVTDPRAQVQKSTANWSETEVDTQHYTKVDSYSKEKSGTSTTQTLSLNTKVFATTVQTDVTEKTTDKQHSWSYNYAYQLMPISDEDPTDPTTPGGGGGSGETPTEPTVPGNPGNPGNSRSGETERANAPQTGDITAILALTCLLSAGGIWVLNRKKEEA